MDEPEVELPWMDDRLPVSEAVEIVARASMEDSEELAALREQIEGDGASVADADGEGGEGGDLGAVREDIDGLREDLDDLRTRVGDLESSSGVECPNCGADGVLKAGVAAAVLVRERRLSETNVAALDEAPLVCMECMTAFSRA